LLFSGDFQNRIYITMDQEPPRINENAAIENGNEVRERIINTYFLNNRPF